MVTSPKASSPTATTVCLRPPTHPLLGLEFTTMNDLKFAVEFAHDENLLSHENVSHLSEFLSLLTLKTAEEQTEDFHILHEKLMQLKLESHQLDANFHSPDYYAQKEELIFKVVCEIKGIDHDKWLRDEQGFGEPTAPLGDYLQDEFVCDDCDDA